jgi:hypothetical protein
MTKPPALQGLGKSLPFQRLAASLCATNTATEIPVATLSRIADLKSHLERMEMIDYIDALYASQGLVPHDTLSDFLNAVARQSL